MLVIQSQIPLKADHREQALELMREMAKKTRAEAGCISYEYYVSLDDENQVLLLQEWEDESALEAHFGSAHMEAFLAELPPFLAGEVVTRRSELYTEENMHELLDEAAGNDDEPELLLLDEDPDELEADYTLH